VYIRESYQQLREHSLLAIVCHICIMLSSWWCDIVLNAHAPTEEKIDDSKTQFL
jgi:hypothetical protein